MAELLPPADLMFDILLRLPVKYLVRFRCVCKGWRDLIDSRNFAKSHLNCLSNRSPSLLVLRHENINTYNAYDIVDLSSAINDGPALAFKEYPLPADGHSAYYEGQCNGLVCLSYFSCALLWNPATGKQFQFGLPTHEISFQNWGFGYDKDSDDYKVVAFDLPETAEVNVRYLVWIYSLKSRSWKYIDEFPYLFESHYESGVFVNGALHWKVYQRESEVPVISALCLGRLEYSLVPAPDYSSENTFMEFEYLGVLDGRLCAVYYDSNCEGFDLWTMKEYRVKESWTKLIRCANNTMELISSAYLQDDEVLLFAPYFDEKFGCEFRTISFGRGHEIEIRSSGRLCKGYWPYVYVPSLVCPQNVW